MAVPEPRTRGGTPRRERLLRRVIQRILLSPASLGLSSAALVLATDSATWLPAAVVAALNGAYLFVQARSPAFVRRVALELERDQWRDEIQRAEVLQRALSPAVGVLLGNLIRGQERLQALAAADDRLAPSRAQSADLLRHCLQLAERRVEMENFLAETRAGDLECEAASLRRQAAETDDPVARQLFEQALEQKLAEIDNLKAVEKAIARIDGQLAAVDATYDNLVGKIARVRMTHEPHGSSSEDHVMAELAHLARNAAALETSLHETLTLRGPA